MKTRHTSPASAVLIVGLASLWSAAIPAAEPSIHDSEAATRTATIEKASEAASEAAADAIDSIARDAAQDLDGRLTDLNLAAREAATITIAAN